MKRGLRVQKGFLLVEVLMAILVIAVTFAAFMGAMVQALKISDRSSQVTDAVSEFKSLLFEMESGIRPDLVSYGGRGNFEGNFRYTIDAQTQGGFESVLKSEISQINDQKLFEVDVVVLRAPVQ